MIVGVGAIDTRPSGRADPAMLAELRASKILTLTSTYDHRIIQGAESGLFLKRVEELLLGADGFYDEIFASLGVPYEAIRWRRDVNPLDREQTALEKQMAVATLIRVYRVRGHLIADLDPLRWKEPQMAPELDPATYGLTIWDLDREFLTGGLGGRDKAPLSEILRILRDAYCRTIGIEYMHIQDPEEQRWIQEQVENPSRQELDTEDLRHILSRLNGRGSRSSRHRGWGRSASAWRQQSPSHPRRHPQEAADDHLDGVVMGMPHRGRLNVLANIVGKSYDQIFKEFGRSTRSVQGSGDVKYHLGQVGKFQSRSGNQITVELAANPSHLEAVDPVVEGMVRAKQDQINRPDAFSVLPVLMHGDAAFAGQGVVAETLNMSDIKGYRVGGTIHVVVNNQIGFTTTPEAARSGIYATDLAKIVQAPIFHVNGDDPEACVRVARLAYAYRQRFHKDVVIDLVSYRRHGHNEADDPSYTQPLMYAKIDERRSVRKLFTESLVKRGQLTLEEAEEALDEFRAKLQQALDETRQSAPPSNLRAAEPPPPRGVLPPVETGVDRAVLDRVYDALSAWPEDFNVHPKLLKQMEARDKMYREQGEVDEPPPRRWPSVAAARGHASLRRAGLPPGHLQPAPRRAGRPGHRPGVSAARHLGPEQAKFWIYDSRCRSTALGFEYGYRWPTGRSLLGGAVRRLRHRQHHHRPVRRAAETSGTQPGPVSAAHGYEGQGPEHSSARIERFLILCADDNIQVANATTAAQYFHLLRRQMRREVRKPLVVFTPKSLLRARATRSPVSAFERGHFREVLDDPRVEDPAAVRRVVLASGMVGQEAIAERDKRGVPVAVVRVEQLYRAGDQIAEAVARYPNARSSSCREPANMGAWSFVRPAWPTCSATRTSCDRSAPRVGQPARRVDAIHVQEQEAILDADTPATGPHPPVCVTRSRNPAFRPAPGR